MEPNPAQPETPITPVDQAPPQPENPVQMPVDPQLLAQTPPVQPSVDTLSGFTPPSPLVKKKSSKMKWLIIIILLVALAIPLFLGGYFFLVKGGITLKPSTATIKTAVVTPTPTLAPVSTESGTLIATTTASWKTYTNSANLFSLKYPSAFSVSEKIDKQNYANFHKENVDHTYYNLTFTTGQIVNGQPDWSGFGIIVSPTNGRTIQEEYSGQQGVNGPVGIKYINEKGGSDEAADLTNIENGVRVYRVKDKFFNVATFQNGNTLPDGSDAITSQLLLQILSTIKFTQ